MVMTGIGMAAGSRNSSESRTWSADELFDRYKQPGSIIVLTIVSLIVVVSYVTIFFWLRKHPRIKEGGAADDKGAGGIPVAPGQIQYEGAGAMPLTVKTMCDSRRGRCSGVGPSAQRRNCRPGTCFWRR